MKKLIFGLCLVAALGLFFWYAQQHNPHFPSPTTDTQIKFGEDGEQQDKREQWFESMHRAAEGVSWRQLEYRNQLQRHQERVANAFFRSDCSIENLADGQVKGRWRERGSVNQAGSVFDIEYDAATDEIWLLSAGGTLWKADRFGIEWQVVNQDLRFNPGLLKFIPTPQGRRLIAFSGNLPHYSDDDGMS